MPGSRRGRTVSTVATWVALVVVSALAACTSTVDSVGYNGVGGVHLRPLKGPDMYPNPFGVLGKTDAQISDKITQTFNQLFHGDPNSQAIYFEIGTEQASIQDILHGSQVRTEGIGLAMMICVELDKRDEFDRLWNYATDLLEYKDGTRRGYFKSICDTAAGETEVCDDPYGEAQMTTALIFAHDRWGSTTGNINYETGAVSLLDVMRHKQDQNGGIVGGITNTFDEVTGLPFDMPVSWMAVARRGRPSIVMPAYYDLWARATGDAFWSRAAVAGREYWKKVAYPTTGLMPVRATFSGGMVPDWNTFMPEAYRAQINMALDFIWSLSGGEQWNRDEADNLITFFSNQGIDFYGTSYTLDGTPLNPVRDNALVAVNGITAGIATQINRSSFVNEVWGMATPTGLARYYDGILNLTALMILGGQYRVQ